MGFLGHIDVSLGFPGNSVAKNPPANVGDVGSIPGLGRSPGEQNGNPLQYSCLEKTHGWRDLVGYSLWGCKRVRTQLNTHACINMSLTL